MLGEITWFKMYFYWEGTSFTRGLGFAAQLRARDCLDNVQKIFAYSRTRTVQLKYLRRLQQMLQCTIYTDCLPSATYILFINKGNFVWRHF